MNKHLLSVVIGVLLFTVNSAFSQNHRYLSHIFHSDSIKGFDEAKANQDALSHGFFGKEYKVFMYRAKRNFINEKYGYFISQTAMKGSQPSVLASGCVNEGFESSLVGAITSTNGVAGWTITQGQNSNSCAMSGCCLINAISAASVVSTPYACPAPLNNVPNSPLGGSKVIQLNDNIPNMGEVVRLEKTINVTPSNNIFKYAYMACFNGSGHACCDQPYLQFRMYDCFLNPVNCVTHSVIASGLSCTTTTTSSTWITSTSGVSYMTGWEVRSVDLSMYIGSCVMIQFTLGDCDGWAHEGWGFFDSKCDSASIKINNVPTMSYTTCASTATITAPSAFAPFIWNGPPGSGIVNNTSSTITTTASGLYTLTTGPGVCPSTKIVSLTVSAPGNVSIGASALTICQGGTVNLTANGSGMTSYTWNTGATTPTIAATPSVSTTFSVAGTNTAGCVYSASQIINVSLCLGIEQNNIDNASLVIYPNPNSGTFNIQSKKEEIVTITNELGQLIQTINLNTQNKYKYMVTNLSDGIYFVNSKDLKQKIVVQH